MPLGEPASPVKCRAKRTGNCRSGPCCFPTTSPSPSAGMASAACSTSEQRHRLPKHLRRPQRIQPKGNAHERHLCQQRYLRALSAVTRPHPDGALHGTLSTLDFDSKAIPSDTEPTCYLTRIDTARAKSGTLLINFLPNQGLSANTHSISTLHVER